MGTTQVEGYIGGYTIFYTENTLIKNTEGEDEIKVELKKRILPVELKDKFLEQLGSKIPTSEQVECFFSENKI